MKFSKASEVLYKGRVVKGMDFNKPEAFPLFANTSFTMKSLDEVKEAYESKYTYVRTGNPNRDSLAEIVSYLENGEDTLIFSSGMGAITTTILSLIKPGDHIICNRNIYGETFDVMMKFLPTFNIETTLVDFDNIENVRNAIQDNTKMIYSEVLANPTINVADIPALAEIAHAKDILVMIDNTFTSPIAIQPIVLGADIVINSMTKFMNGHSDAIAGSITATSKIIETIRPVRMLCGTPGDPNAAWMMIRGIQTIDLRLKKQMSNAAILAKALEENKYITKVNHPSLKSFPQHELAIKLFGSDDTMSGMMSFIVPEDDRKVNEFMKKLNFAHYATTLGGLRTTLNHPVTSSHSHMPDEDRRKMGVTPGMFRLSVGIEDVDDLIADFNQALEVFGEK